MLVTDNGKMFLSIVVELVRRDWNTLAEVILEWSAVLSGRILAKKSA
jgi:hypothetical protein